MVRYGPYQSNQLDKLHIVVVRWLIVSVLFQGPISFVLSHCRLHIFSRKDTSAVGIVLSLNSRARLSEIIFILTLLAVPTYTHNCSIL